MRLEGVQALQARRGQKEQQEQQEQERQDKEQKQAEMRQEMLTALGEQDKRLSRMEALIAQLVAVKA